MIALLLFVSGSAFLLIMLSIWVNRFVGPTPEPDEAVWKERFPNE